MKVPEPPMIYTSNYTDFKGVDFTSQIVDKKRFPIAKNFEITDFVKKRDGWSVINSFSQEIYGIFQFKDCYIIHSGTELYKVSSLSDSNHTLIKSGISSGKSTGFLSDNNFFILTGAEYIKIDKDFNVSVINGNEDLFKIITVDGKKQYVRDSFAYVPQNASGTNVFLYSSVVPTKGWTYEDIINEAGITYSKHEEFNNLTEYAYISYSSFSYNKVVDTSKPKGFILPDFNSTALFCYLEIDDKIYNCTVHGCKISLMVNGNTEDTRKFYYAVTDDDRLSSDFTGKPFKIYYQVKKEDPNKIYKCKEQSYLQYGNGIYHFFTCNSDNPNKDWQSAINDATYFPSNKYTIYGADDDILGYGQYGEYLAVFKKGNIDTNIYVRSANYVEGLGVTFPVSVGVGGAIGGLSARSIKNLDGETLYLTNQGVYALTSLSLTNMKVTKNRSYYVDGKLLRENNLENSVACVFRNKYYLCINDNCYILDSTQPKDYLEGTNNEFAYECLYWENVPATVFMPTKDILYFGTKDGKVCKFVKGQYNDNGVPVEMVVATKFDDDGDYMTLKKMKKKGTGIILKPYQRSTADISFRYDDYVNVKVKTSYADMFDFNDIDFERLTFITSDTPRSIPFLKKSKKYKSLQIIIKSNVNEPLGIIGIIKRYVYDNYVKRS